MVHIIERRNEPITVNRIAGMAGERGSSVSAQLVIWYDGYSCHLVSSVALLHASLEDYTVVNTHLLFALSSLWLSACGDNNRGHSIGTVNIAYGTLQEYMRQDRLTPE